MGYFGHFCGRQATGTLPTIKSSIFICRLLRLSSTGLRPVPNLHYKRLIFGGAPAPPPWGIGLKWDSVSEGSPFNFVVSCLFNAIFWHNVYFISTIFYKYNYLQNDKKYSILSLCDGNILILNNFSNLESPTQRFFINLASIFLEFQRLAFSSSEWVANCLSITIFHKLFNFLYS